MEITNAPATENTFEASVDKRDNNPQRSGAKRGNRRRGGRGKNNNATMTNNSKPLSDVANISSIPLTRCSVTKVQ